MSPHLDDGVLSCGDLLARHRCAAVITIFAGRPAEYGAAPSEWDAAAGFGAGDDVVGARRAEDAAALRILGAWPVWLDFLDAQYGLSQCAEPIARALGMTIHALGCSEVYIPLGLFHSDHKLAHEAAARVLRERPELSWRAYADALYRRIPGLVDERLAGLENEGLVATEIRAAAGPATPRKRQAVECYASQLRALATAGRPGHEDAFGRERYWRLQLAGGRASRTGALPV